MACMLVMLDVSKFSGWLNATACCPVEREAYEEGRVAGGRWEAAAAEAACWEGPTMGAAGRARAERTVNMCSMVVTLDVFQLSGWLNACAFCRVEREACGKRGGMWGRAKVRAWGRRRRKQRAGSTPTAEVVLAGARAERT